jgi:hypothetical protein
MAGCKNAVYMHTGRLFSTAITISTMSFAKGTLLCTVSLLFMATATSMHILNMGDSKSYGNKHLRTVAEIMIGRRGETADATGSVWNPMDGEHPGRIRRWGETAAPAAEASQGSRTSLDEVVVSGPKAADIEVDFNDEDEDLLTVGDSDDVDHLAEGDPYVLVDDEHVFQSAGII